MHYQISRNGQMYGPYTLEDLQRYVASGNVLPTDLAKSEAMTEWMPVSQILAGAQGAGPAEAGSFPAAPGAGAAPAQSGWSGAAYPQGAATTNLTASPYPDAPNLHWALVILFTVLTCGIFMIVWNLVVNAWLKRVQPNATSLLYYAGAYGLMLVQLVSFHGMYQSIISPGTHVNVGHPIGSLLGVAVWVLRLVARYMERASLEEHFNGPEPMNLRVDAVMTFFFGGVYFQYKLNQINGMKNASRFGARAY